MTDLHAEYVIVGAGSAGCVLADRLSEGGAQVVLLEAGPTDWYPWIHIPAAMRKLLVLCFGVLKTGKEFDPAMAMGK